MWKSKTKILLKERMLKKQCNDRQAVQRQEASMRMNVMKKLVDDAADTERGQNHPSYYTKPTSCSRTSACHKEFLKVAMPDVRMRSTSQPPHRR